MPVSLSGAKIRFDADPILAGRERDESLESIATRVSTKLKNKGF